MSPEPPRRSKFELDFQNLHEGAKAFDVRSQDKVLARVRKRSDTQFIPMQVWDTSARAIELVYPAVHGNQFEKGDSVDLEVTVGGQRMYFEGLVVNEIAANENTRRLGIRYAKRLDRWTQQERRGSPRWMCNDQFYPVCVATSPFVTGSTTIFQVRDVSPEGMKLVCDLSKTYLIPQLNIRLTVNFPMVGDFVTTVKVARIGFDSIGGKDLLSIGVKFIKLSEAMREVIAQYLIEFSNVPSLKILRENGLKPPEPKRGVQFYFIKSEEDIRAVWHLRKKAHVHAHNLSDSEISDEEMGDRYDMESRIIAGVFNGLIVATARIHFGGLDQPLEHEEFLEWPNHLPRRDKIFEISRAAIDPDFQNGDLLVGLIQFIANTCMREEKPFIVISSWPYLVPLYKKLGFSETGLTHKEDFWKHEQHVLLADGSSGLFGSNISPIVWNAVWRPAAERIIENGIMEPRGINAVRYRVYRLFGGITKVLEKFHRRPRKRKKS